MPSPRYTRSPNTSKVSGDPILPEPPPPGTGDCNTKYTLNVYSVHILSTSYRRPVDKSPESFHSQGRLSTETVDKSLRLWIRSALNKEFRQFVAFDRSSTCG